MRKTRGQFRERRIRSAWQGGQVMPIAVIIFIVLCGVAGLAIDSSRDYLTKRDAQNAADFAAIAAAKQIALSGNVSSAVVSGSSAVIAAHDFAANNGFGTIYSTGCDASFGSSFSATWFDTSGTPCTATTGFTNKVSVHSPAVDLPSSPVPPICKGPAQYTCLQVTITTKVAELFASVLGISTAYITVGGTAHATLPGVLYNTPPPNAMVLYEPYSGCALQQCFNAAQAPSRAPLLTCSGTGNCPTFWVQPNAGIDIYGYDGAVLNPSTDQTTLQSNGAMVVQGRSTLCDPYSGVACVHNAVVGSKGFAVAGGAPVYCSSYGGAANSTPCSTTGSPAPAELDAAQTSFNPPSYWTPSVDTSALVNCGALVLNGGPVPSGPCANAKEPYVISPGIYQYIVINHGTYEFDQGLFDITGLAPVNTASGAGYSANGIDHSREVAADFDLCTTAAGVSTACPTLTAGVWIGHGAGSYGTYVAPTAGTCIGSTGSGSSGGGGDNTIVSGSGVVIRLEKTSGGFVSTHEVSNLSLSGAGVGQLTSIAGAPLLLDLENSGFIHLDAIPAKHQTNSVQGVIYQNPNATAGGVELNPGMTSNPGAALYGQILAYSFTTFGTFGTMDFTGGYGTGSVPGIATSGKNETSIIAKVALTAGATGYSVLTVSYTDEWSLDGSDVYVKVNNGSPIFFSQGIWNPAPSAGSPQPPPGNNPGDQHPAYIDPTNPGPYVVNPLDSTDWTYTIPSSGGAKIELTGSWTWGHQSDITGAASGAYTASAIYTFPTPSGSYVAITVFMSDGDHCGDYALASYTFKNVGQPGGGGQSLGTVQLVQ